MDFWTEIMCIYLEVSICNKLKELPFNFSKKCILDPYCKKKEKMYIIDKEKNRISKLQKKTFTELKFKEREHLQEWIANNPSSLGEELLIIQKEFSGFGETKERLDLLALDKQGNLVIIETIENFHDRIYRDLFG